MRAWGCETNPSFRSIPCPARSLRGAYRKLWGPTTSPAVVVPRSMAVRPSTRVMPNRSIQGSESSRCLAGSNNQPGSGNSRLEADQRWERCSGCMWWPRPDLDHQPAQGPGGDGMKLIRKGAKAPRTSLRTRDSGPSMPQTRLLAAVNRIDAAPTTFKKWAKGQLSLAFSAAS